MKDVTSQEEDSKGSRSENIIFKCLHSLLMLRTSYFKNFHMTVVNKTEVVILYDSISAMKLSCHILKVVAVWLYISIPLHTVDPQY